MEYRRLPLGGIRNIRDLGGYPTKDGGVTAFRRFIRSEAPKSISEKDIEFLKAYGVTLVIDFRGDEEIKRIPNGLADVAGIEYVRCVTFDRQVAFTSRTDDDEKKPEDEKRPAMDAFVDWGEKYIEIVGNAGDWVRDTLRLMANAEGGVIFNCATGKDRTGIISALLLGLADVAEYDIVADYSVSELYLRELYEEMLEMYLKRWPDEKADINSPFFKTTPVNMETLLKHINEAHGGAAGYVKSCGITDAEIASLRKRFIK